MTSNQPNISAGHLIADCLRTEGVEFVYCVPGESYLEVLDGLYDHADQIRMITCRHEAGAAHMAEAYGKLTGRPGICMVTRGPGACHASIGVHCAAQNSTPMVLFVGQVDRGHLGWEAFQEIDYQHMFGSIAKWVTEIRDAQTIPDIISRAFTVAMSDRPGPVVVSLPEDMQLEFPGNGPNKAVNLTARPVDRDHMTEMTRLLAGAQRPLLLLGGSGWTQQACDSLRQFAEREELPMCCAFRRQDLSDNTHPQHVGDLPPWTSPALVDYIQQSDLILAVGARLGEITTQRYGLFNRPAPQMPLIHVHADVRVLGRVFKPTLAIQSRPDDFARALDKIPASGVTRRQGWIAQGRGLYESSLIPEFYAGALDIGAVMVWLRHELPADAVITLDAGNFSAWPMQFLQWRQLHTQLGSQAGAMGPAVPQAVAASLLHPQRLVIGFVGDGGFMMNAQELATAVQHGAHPIILLFNNGMYGTIRMHQEREHPNRTIATDLSNPDFQVMAAGIGCHCERVASTEEFAGAFARARDSARASVIELCMDADVINPRTTLSAIRKQALAINPRHQRHGGE